MPHDTTAQETLDPKRDAKVFGMRDGFKQSELVIGLVGAVGTELKVVVEALEDKISKAKYKVSIVHVSQQIIEKLSPQVGSGNGTEYERISSRMDAGNEARCSSGNNAILALGAAARIQDYREKKEDGVHGILAPRQAHIIKSLKHPDEVLQLRHIYSRAFYLVGVYSDKKRRMKELYILS